eukprot:CAMPEP_0197025302 /NCGR_PEP_ID=MMETSP1384-20130603/5680_1 /TAXON_ID=29189 /ORGANISM="Ammonia sp." /LENGTH=553 /DNA_ID=CAMNT_0042453819 /DNA_START=29 /DNA_END=1690 /DNA_ORIENTATION=+
MSTIHTEASVAASEVEPSASGVYDYSESINDNDEKLDEGLRAPIPIHDDAYDLDTSLLSDNELEAFVKSKTHYAGKQATIPPNLQHTFTRLSGYNKWDPQIYQDNQVKLQQSDKQKAVNFIHPTIASVSGLGPSTQLQQDMSYSEMDPSNQPEPSPFPYTVVTPAASQANLGAADTESMELMEPQRKQTYPGSPITASNSLKPTEKPNVEQKGNDADKANEKTSNSNRPRAVAECSMKEMMKHVSNLTSEVIQLQQSLYVKDIVIKNLYLRLKEFDHISFPQLHIERIHIMANYNNKHKFSHKSNRASDVLSNATPANTAMGSVTVGTRPRVTSTEEDSVAEDHYLGNGYDHIGGGSYRSSNTFSALKPTHSSVTLEVITRWLPRYSLPTAVKKGLVFIKDDDISDIDDYLTHQMYGDFQDKLKMPNQNRPNVNKHNLDKIKRDEVLKQLSNYMQHERVGLVRIEILKGKKYKKYKRIEKKFESLIIPISDIPKGDTYHIMIKVHNPSASLWGPLSNLVSIKVPLKFADDDDTDNDGNEKGNKTPKRSSHKKK